MRTTSLRGPHSQRRPSSQLSHRLALRVAVGLDGRAASRRTRRCIFGVEHYGDPLGRYPRGCDDGQLQLPLHDRQFAGPLARRVGSSRILSAMRPANRDRASQGRAGRRDRIRAGCAASKSRRSTFRSSASQALAIDCSITKFAIRVMRSSRPSSCRRAPAARRRNITCPPSSWTRTIS